MPHSLVLNLTPISPIPPGYLTGKHLHALFLTLVSSVDQTLGDRLHEQKTDKAFTLSPLQVYETKKVEQRMRLQPRTSLLQWQHTRSIPAETPCWWRISLLDDTLFGHLTQLWLNLNPSHPWHLGPANLQIISVLGTPQSTQPWANYTSYAQLYEEASEEECQIDLTFYTPTAFRQSQFDCALPTRENVFNSLRRRWNQYSGIEFSESLLEPIFPSFFDIRTELVADSRSKFIGCVGMINFRILGDVEPLIIKQINTLANFTLYSGIGRKTPMGMGMVRRV
jgi:CRISPR-associated endoribonuclease Cas6